MPQWTLFENDFRSIDLVLAELLERTNALSAHLIDRSGQLINSAGRVDDFDAMSFASLVAADFTANAELANVLPPLLHAPCPHGAHHLLEALAILPLLEPRLLLQLKGHPV